MSIYDNCLQGIAAHRKKVFRDRVLDVIPSNWLDPLLSGKDAVNFPLKCPDVERLVNGIRERVRHALNGQ